MPVFQDEGKISSIFYDTSSGAQRGEIIKSLCTVVLGSGTGTIIPPQALLPHICSGT